MSRNARTLIVVAIGLVAATVASVLMYRTIKQLKPVEIEVRSVDAVVAAHPLTLGARITADDVRVVKWPASSPIKKGFTSVEAALNRGVIVPISENEPLTENNVASPEEGAGLPPSIPPGMRAISVRVNEVIGVAGFVVPGTRVDVMVLLKRGNESIARIVTSNVQVLTAGTRYDQESAKSGQAIPSTVVTLLVTPEDASRIGLASSDGQIMLTLRNPTDAAQTTGNVVRGSALSNETASEAAPAPTETTPQTAARHSGRPRASRAATPTALRRTGPPKDYTVETIRAAKRTAETLKTEETPRTEENGR